MMERLNFTAQPIPFLQRRIMWRIALVVVAISILGTIAISSYFQQRENRSERELAQIALAEVQDDLQTMLDDVLVDAVNISRSSALRDYVQELQLTLLREGGVAYSLDESILGQMRDLIDQNPELVLSIRYVTRDGQVTGTLINQRDFVQVVQGVSDAPEIIADPIFNTALSAAPASDVYLSQVHPAQAGSIPEHMEVYIPVYIQGEASNIAGVIDVTLATQSLTDLLTDAFSDRRIGRDGRRIALIDNAGNVLAAYGAAEDEIQRLVTDLDSQSLEAGIYGIGDTVVAYVSIIDDYAAQNAPWRVVIFDPDRVFWQESPLLIVALLALPAAFILFILLPIYFLLRPLMQPLETLQDTAGQLAEDHARVPVPAPVSLVAKSQRTDEIARLYGTMGRISERITHLQERLDMQQRRYARDMEVISRIGRETATLHELDQLLNQAIHLICQEFDFYHAQVFLVDEIGENAVLAHSHGDVGRQLLARNFKIRIGSNSVVGTVAKTGRPVIVNDTTRATADGLPHLPNPYLPDTRAELGMPMFIGEQAIGVLDIQSKEAQVFNEEDLPTFRLVADQLAVAVYNARLVNQSARRIEQIDELNRQLTLNAWDNPESRLELAKEYTYNLLDVEIRESQMNGEHGNGSSAYATPIRLRGEVIGSLNVAPDEQHELSDGDQAIMQSVAERVSLAIENARLFQETQANLWETITLYELSRSLNEANTLEDILNAIITSVMKDAAGGQIWMFDDYLYSLDGPEWMELEVDLVRQPRSTYVDLIGTRVRLEDYPVLRELGDDAVLVVPDIQHDAHFQNMLSDVFELIEVRSVVFIPLTVRGLWRGIIMIGFKQERSFNEREQRTYNALIDQAGVAIDNRLLLQQTEEEVTRNQNLYAASRIINSAQNMQDLVYAAVVTANDTGYDYSLSLVEDILDENGWPQQIRLVARSKGGEVLETNEIYTIQIPADTPMTRRDPHIIIDEDPQNQHVPNLVQWVRGQGYRYMAIFPLYSVNRLVAFFSIACREIRELDENDHEVYRALTGQMSSQLQIRREQESTRRALEETRRLYMASNALTTAVQAQTVYQIVMEHLAAPFSQYYKMSSTRPEIQIHLLMASPLPALEAPYLVYGASWHISEGTQEQLIGQRLRSKDYPYGTLSVSLDEPFVCNNLMETSESTALLMQDMAFYERLQDDDILSLVVAPLRTRSRWFGVIVCKSDHAQSFTEEYVRFITTISEQAGTKLDSLWALDQAQIERDRAQAEASRALLLARVAQLANRIGLDFNQGIGGALERTAREAGFDRWALLLMNPEQTHMTSVALRIPGFDKQPLTYPVEWDRTQASIPLVDVISLNQPLLINDPVQYPGYSLNPAYQPLMRAFGKHSIVTVQSLGQPVGVLLMGCGLELPDLDKGDERVVETIATQIALARESRNLFESVQREQRTLHSILTTLPTGVIVLEPDTLIPREFNEQAEAYLGREIDPRAPFSIERYNLYRTGTQLLYPADEMPIFVALQTGQAQSSDDVAVILPPPKGQIDLLLNAAPIVESDGVMTAIVVTLQDISNLRSLENTLQENLRETVALYEMQRQLSEAVELEEVLDVVISQLILLQPDDAFVLLMNEYGELATVRHLVHPLPMPEIFNELLSPDSLINIQDIDQTTRIPDDVRGRLKEAGVRSMMSAPMHASSQLELVGWLVVTSEDSHAFLGVQHSLLTRLADIASTAIDNRYLIERLSISAEEQEALFTTNAAISRTRDLDQLSEVLLDSLLILKPDYVGGYLDNNTGLGVETLELFSHVSSSHPSIDFEGIMIDYPLPESGLFVDDLFTVAQTIPNPVYKRLLEEGIRSFGAIHLRMREETNGFLIVGYLYLHIFTASERRYMNMIVDSAANVFNNIILFEQVQENLEETTTVYQASKAVSSAKTPAEIVDAVVTYLIPQPANQVFVALLKGQSWQEPDVSIEIVAGWHQDAGIDLTGVTLNEAQFPAWRLLSGAQDVLTINDIYADETINEMERMGVESLDARAVVIIPLRVPSRVLGLLWISSDQDYQFGDRDIRTFQAFGEQASLALQAAFLLDEANRRARQLETSSKVSQNAGNILDLKVLLDNVVNLIKEAFGYDHVQVFLMDEAHENAVLRASTGEAGRQLLFIQHSLPKGSKSVIGQVTATGRPQIALDTADANVIHLPNAYLPLTRSEMAMPLMIKDRVMGALDVQSNEPNAFSAEDIRALATLAAQISVAIENASLYEDIQQQAAKNVFLFNVTTAAVSAGTLEEALNNVVDSLQLRLRATATAVYLRRIYLDTSDNEFVTLKMEALAGIRKSTRDFEEIRLDDPDNIISILKTSPNPVMVDNLLLQPLYRPLTHEAQSAALLPLVSSGELLGMIVIESSRLSAFSQDELTFLRTLTNSLSSVVRSFVLLDELQATAERLRELDRLKNDFLANMSHELRTPLNSIIGFSRVMLKGIDGPLTEMQEQDLNTIYTSGNHLLMLINDILDQAKISAGRLDVKLDYFEVKPLIEVVKSIGIGLVKDKTISLSVEIASNLPLGYGDEFRTRQVLINMVSNAAKFTNQGYIVIRAYPFESSALRQTMIRIDVEDTGIGIAEKDMPLLFEPFRQVDSSLTKTHGGTGLGLPIAKSLVEMQGGEMFVESQVNVGSIFSITIPTQPVITDEKADDDEDIEKLMQQAMSFRGHKSSKEDDKSDTAELEKAQDISKPTIEMQALTTTAPQDKPKLPRVTTSTTRIIPASRDILLIEDNKDMVDQFRRTLQREGYILQTADHPVYTEAMASTIRPVVIIMDVNFAHGEGWNILQRLKDRDDTFDIPIIVVTLSSESERVFQLGAFEFMQRPFIPEDLISAVRRAERESNRERILIIDDQPEDIRLLTHVLSESGTYRVFSAENGTEGIALVARRRPDLVILDLRMPEMDGFAVLNELRSNPETANIPVMIVTGEADLSIAEQHQLAGVHVLPKSTISQQAYDQFITDVRRHLEIEEN